MKARNARRARLCGAPLRPNWPTALPAETLARAVESYEAAIHTDPQLREAHYHLAQLYRRTGERAKAEQELAAYNRISREVLDQNEREAHEIPQFVYTLRDSKSPASQQ